MKIKESNSGTLNFLKAKKGYFYLGSGKFKRNQSTFNFTRIKKKLRQRTKST